jgi:hypothetical protein
MNTAVVSTNRESRFAGFWYLALAVFGAIGILVAGAKFLVPGDAVATAALIQADGLLFRLGIAANLVGQVCFVFVGLAFYRLFRSVDENLARALVALVVVAVPIAFLNTVFKFAPLVLLGGESYLKVFEPAQLQALALFFLKLQDYGTLIVSVFWGLWLLPLGVLTWRSGFFPKLLGALLLVNGFSYVVDSFVGMVVPEWHRTIAPVMGVLLAIGEIPFLVWLLVRGARVH